jgi:hypothetical protein
VAAAAAAVIIIITEDRSVAVEGTGIDYYRRERRQGERRISSVWLATTVEVF